MKSLTALSITLGIVFASASVVAQEAAVKRPELSVNYTEAEARAAILLYDQAVRAAGLQSAQNALHLTRKLEEALAAANKK